MKLIKLAFVAFSILLFISGCNHDYGAKNASTDAVQQMINHQQTGFVIITNEIDATFLDEVQKMVLKKRKRLYSSMFFTMMVKIRIQTDLVRIHFALKCPM